MGPIMRRRMMMQQQMAMQQQRQAEPMGNNIWESAPLCGEPGCPALATWGIPGGSPLKCREHKSLGMVENPATSAAAPAPPASASSLDSVCSFSKCQAAATWGFPDDRKPLYCQAHKDDESMVEVLVPTAPAASSTSTSSTCEFVRCKNDAQFGFPDEPGVARYCTQHKDDTMVEVAPPKPKCEFVRCESTAEYGFADEGFARFCPRHKDDATMILVTAVNADALVVAGSDLPVPPQGPPNPAPAPAPVSRSAPPPVANTKLSSASVTLLKEYRQLQREAEELSTAGRMSAQGKSKVAALEAELKKEEKQTRDLAAEVDDLEARLKRQNMKPSLGGMSLMNSGIFLKDTKKIEALEEEKAQKEALVVVGKSEAQEKRAELDKALAAQVQLDSSASRAVALKSRMEDIHSSITADYASPALAKLRNDSVTSRSLHQQLSVIMEDVQKCAQMYMVALKKQRQAARRNAAAGGANIGQMAQGRRGGFGQNPGERMLQMSRNAATRESVIIAQQATETLKNTFARIPEDLRRRYPQAMANVGNVALPALWTGSFFKDFLVGGVAGNVGDAVNEARSMAKIRRNMQELEGVIALCQNQLQLMSNVEKHLTTEITRLQGEQEREAGRLFTDLMAQVP